NRYNIKRSVMITTWKRSRNLGINILGFAHGEALQIQICPMEEGLVPASLIKNFYIWSAQGDQLSVFLIKNHPKGGFYKIGK
ncbi:MAG TPA: hypothetical protein PLW93_00505, partial [Candidatus Absconditabacterales bacterium]|nr:hypothetical protein [Candidatus Absconditabacterales bacterium]